MAAGLELGVALGMASVHLEMVSQMGLDMASGMPLESKLIEWARLFPGDPQ